MQFQFRDAAQTAIILASGPTAGAADPAVIEGWPVLAVNDGIYLYPKAAALYAADWRWWDLHIGEIRKQAPSCQLWTSAEKSAKAYGLHYIGLDRGPGLSLDKAKIRTGGQIGNSGAQAMNLAVLWGARRLVLVGFDMKQIDGRSHYFGEHPAVFGSGCGYSVFVEQMGPMCAEILKAGIRVVNTSRQSALPYFEYQNLPLALRATDAGAAVH